MVLIGIISSKKNETILEKSIKSYFKNFNFNVVLINENNIYNIKNIKFDIIIMNEENSIVNNEKYLLKKILANTKFLMLNSDFYSKLDLLNRLKLTIFTYGMNQKSTITASSIEDGKICVCIQRAILNNNGELIEPRESSIEAKFKDIYINIILYTL